LSDDLWQAPKRTRHKIPQAWARVGYRVLWEESPYPTDRPRLGRDHVKAVEPGLRWADNCELRSPNGG
jgi:hypothetical protein